jgi:hypothetical protein
VNSIATKINAKSGSDVAIAAAAFLQLVEGKESFSRQELLTSMKAATKFYKTGMSSNLSGYLNSLVGGKLNQIGTGKYCLASAEHARLETALAG